MDLYAVFGSPIRHSLSPVMHNAAFRETGRAAYYFPVRVSPDGLDAALAAFRQLGGVGVNLTRPLKETVLTLPSVVLGEDPWVDKTGAANTLWWSSQEAVWVAGNTDAAALFQTLPPGNGKAALVLGGGGVARASVAAVQARGFVPHVALRRPDRPPGWAEGLAIWPWSKALARPQPWPVVINATPVGQVGEAAWEGFPAMDAMSWVVDWVYHPLQTPLLQAGAVHGSHPINGLQLLVAQAALAWQFWFGEEGPRAVMQSAALGA